MGCNGSAVPSRNMTPWFYEHPGDVVETLVSNAQSEILVVAPFIQARALERLLHNVSASVELNCVTRWLLPEVLNGISDLAAYDVVKSRQGRFWLNQRLHAKLIRVDKRTIVGSANITYAGLGWSGNSNLELLTQTESADPMLRAFEEALFSYALEVDDGIHKRFVGLAAQLGSQLSEYDDGIEILQNSQPEVRHSDSWLPCLSNPENLYLFDVETCRDGGKSLDAEAAAVDLAVLDVPLGLDRESFEQVVSTSLLTLPMITRIDRLLKTERRFGEMRAFLAEWLEVSSDEAGEVWHRTMRWLLYFLPTRYRYRRPAYSELFGRTEL